MEIYLIRHGQSANNASEESGTRVCDPPLTETGRRQAGLVAERLQNLDWARMRDGDRSPGLGLTRLVVSPMVRALETADAIRRVAGLVPRVDLAVHEQGGIWLDHDDGRGPVGLPGLTRGEIRSRFPGFEVPDGFREDGWWNRPWEDERSARARAERVAADLSGRAETEERLGIVSHGGFGSYLIDALLGLPYTPRIRFSMNNTSISRIDLSPEGARLRFSNRADHLPFELLT